ncbi:glycosyltransferase [Candidatus Electrothrix gigas]
MKEHIYIVVVTYNRLTLLLRCLASLRRQSLIPEKIIIVDNASTDGTNEALQEIANEDKRVTYLRLTENIGGSGGFYEGIKHIQEIGEGWIWLMDDDALPEPTALEELSLQAMNSGDIYGSVAVDEKNNSQTLCWPVVLIKEKSKNQRILDAGESLVLEKVNGLPFLGFFIHTSLVRKIGLPDKDFFISGDDMDYSLRAIGTGANLWIVGKSKIRHPLPQRTDINLICTKVAVLNLSPWKRYYDTRNRFLIAKRYHGLKCWTHVIPGTLIRWVFSMLTQKDRMKQTKAFYNGIIDGLMERSGIRWPPGT